MNFAIQIAFENLPLFPLFIFFQKVREIIYFLRRIKEIIDGFTSIKCHYFYGVPVQPGNRKKRKHEKKNRTQLCEGNLKKFQRNKFQDLRVYSYNSEITFSVTALEKMYDLKPPLQNIAILDFI